MAIGNDVLVAHHAPSAGVHGLLDDVHNRRVITVPRASNAWVTQ